MTAAQGRDRLQKLLDEAEIRDAMGRYARGVDRSDWELVRAAYHPDAYDDHGGYKGDIPGLIDWLKDRFADAENGAHFLGNCVIDFAGPDLALVETYFMTQRLGPAPKSETAPERECRQSWGRYVDRFERRESVWRVAHRTVVLDAVLTTTPRSAPRVGPPVWGRRDRQDYFYQAHAQMFGGED